MDAISIYVIALSSLTISLILMILDLKKMVVKMKSPVNTVQVVSKDPLPIKSTLGASGYDLRAKEVLFHYTKEGITSFRINQTNIILEPGERALVSLGIKMKIPRGYELQIRPRSGLALKSGLTVLNTPGTIDSDYLGDIGVILINLGFNPVSINIGDRVCQGVFAKIETPEFTIVETFTSTKRGDNGFGSTGRN